MGIVATLAQKASRDPLDDFWYSRLSYLAPTASGIRVDENIALQVTAVYACVRILAEDIASLPLHVYERIDQGKRRDDGHPLYSVLDQVANPEMDSMILREVLQGHLGLWGNAYASIVRDRAGRVRELWPLRPDRMQVYRDAATKELVYRYTVTGPAGGETIDLPRSDVFHIKAFGTNGLLGLNPIELHRETIGLAVATREYGARFFQNDARPGVVMEVPGTLTPEAVERLRKDTEEKYQGLSRKHRLMVLEEGVKLHEVGIPPETAQYLQTRKFQVAEIARMYRMPLYKIGEGDKTATFASVEQFSLEYVTDTLSPWLKRWEKASGHQLMTEDERQRYFAEHLVDGRLRGDYKTRMEGYKTGLGTAMFTINDVLRKENMNDIGPAGDIRFFPLNMGIIKPDGTIIVPSKEGAQQREEGNEPNA